MQVCYQITVPHIVYSAPEHVQCAFMYLVYIIIFPCRP